MQNESINVFIDICNFSFILQNLNIYTKNITFQTLYRNENKNSIHFNLVLKNKYYVNIKTNVFMCLKCFIVNVYNVEVNVSYLQNKSQIEISMYECMKYMY